MLQWKGHSFQTRLEYSSIAWERQAPFFQALASPWYVSRLPKRPAPISPTSLTLKAPTASTWSFAHVTQVSLPHRCTRACSGARADSAERPWAQPPPTLSPFLSWGNSLGSRPQAVDPFWLCPPLRPSQGTCKCPHPRAGAQGPADWPQGSHFPPESRFPHLCKESDGSDLRGRRGLALAPKLLITFKELLFLLLTWASPVGFFGLLDE